jgi:magnesium-protoporphyrin O-methyltransferase
MEQVSYRTRRGEIEHYFDRTAVQAWARLTSDAPVGRIRTTVRAGRDRMRATLLAWLPADLHGARILDAGCGTGAFAVEAARRGAEVVAVDLSPTLIELAWKRLAQHLDTFAGGGHIEFRAGDMLDASLGRFDYVVAMDSLIHYEAPDAVRALESLAPRIAGSMIFTFAPRTPALAAMHAVGRLFPRGDRAPAIEPVGEADLRRRVHDVLAPQGWRCERSERVANAFYTSQAMRLVRA